VAGGQPTAQGELQKAVPDQIRLDYVLCGGVRLRARRRDHLAKFSDSGGRGGLWLRIALPVRMHEQMIIRGAAARPLWVDSVEKLTG
jgi:hypothetical protein